LTTIDTNAGDDVRTWQWPNYLLTVSDVMTAVKAGFELVTVFEGPLDSPRWALRRDGETSPPGKLSQAAANAAQQKFFGHPIKCSDGSLLYKRKAGN
jgi:hypothetical protein